MTHGGKRQGAGRPRGSKNKRTVEIEQKLKELDCPFEGMERIARQAERKGDLSTAGRMYAELASYLAPKQKSVEVKKGSNNPFEGWNLDQLQNLKEKILDGDVTTHEILNIDELTTEVIN